MREQKSTSLRLRLPAAPLSVRHARHYIRAYLGFAPSIVSQVELALSEAVGDAVVNTDAQGDGEIEVVISLSRDTVELVIRSQLGRPSEMPASNARGLAILLMRSLSGRFEMQTSPERGTTVTMQFPLSPAAT